MDSIDSVLEALFAQKIHRRVLDNGMTILVREDTSSQISSVQLWVKTGSIHEGSLLGAGISHYLEHMLFKGTEKRSGKDMSREVQSLGGYINAYTTFDRTVYYIDLPSEHTCEAMDILADAGFNSTLPSEEVDKERDVILREIDMGLDDPDQRLGRALFETAYRAHPYKYPVIGYKDVFETVTRDELLEYYHARYVPNNMVLVVVGDVDADEIFASATGILGAYPRKRLQNVYIPVEPPAQSKRESQLSGDVNISRVGMAFSIPGLYHEDSPALSLLASILGNGSSSIIWQRLREELGLVHHVDVSTWNPGSSGLLWISMIVDPDKKEAALEAFWGVVEELEEDLVDADRIEKARRQAMVGEINSRRTMSGQAAKIGASEVVVGDLDYPRQYLERIQAVTSEDLNKLICNYITSDRLTLVSLDPEKGGEEEADRSKAERQVPVFEEKILENKAQLLFQESKDFPKVHIRVIFKGGALWEPSHQRGITSLSATLLTKDTEKRTAAEVATVIESVGGSFNEFAGNNTFGLGLEVLPQDVDLALDLLEQSLFHLKLETTSFERERDAQVAHIKETLDDIVDFGIRELRQLYFEDVPYAVNSYGRVEDLEALEMSDVEAFVSPLIQASNCVVSVCGQFDRQSFEEKLTTLVGRLPAGSALDKTVQLDKPAISGRKEIAQDRQQAVVFQAYPCVGVHQDDEMVIASVLDELFSGMSSQLFERVRDEKGLAYYVGSNRLIGLDTGMLFLYGGTHPSTAEQVLDEMTAEIERIRSGKVDEEELDRVKVRLKAQRRMSLQTISARAMQAGLNASYGLPVNDWMNFDAKVDPISNKDLIRFVETYFAEEKRLELIVRPKS